MVKPAFVIPSTDRCIDGMKHWFLTFKLGKHTLNWCKECGLFRVDDEPMSFPRIYYGLQRVLKIKETAGVVPVRESLQPPPYYSSPDDTGCISNDSKHNFKKVVEVVTSKKPKESKVIEICTLCGTLTASKYKYQEPIPNTNRDKITRSRRRVAVGYFISSTSNQGLEDDTDRLYYTLVPDIYLKIEKSYPDSLRSKFWHHAIQCESGTWMEDDSQSPLTESVSGVLVEPPHNAWNSNQGAQEHWCS